MISVTKKIIRFILQDRNIISSDSKDWPSSWKNIETKEYERSINSPLFFQRNDEDERLKSLKTLLEKRRSSRDFSEDKVPIEEILKILTLSAGMIDKEKKYRTYASGGQLYPIEIYYINEKTTDDQKLRRGVYHFSPTQHTLSQVKELHKEDSLAIVTGSPYSFLSSATGCLVFTLCPARNVPKYGWLGLRLGLIETGEILQNIYLTAAALGVKTCAIAGFNPEKVDDLLEIDGLNEVSILMVAIGK